MMLRIFDDRISTKLNDRETGFCRNEGEERKTYSLLRTYTGLHFSVVPGGLICFGMIIL
jgi:hypothetical protein